MRDHFPIQFGPLRRLTILSLDAPLVALAWQQLYATAWEVALEWTTRLVLFLSVWLGYAADRWLDGFTDTRPDPHHDLYRTHRQAVLWLWLVLLATAVATALMFLPSHALKRGWWLLGAVLLYTLFAQCARTWPRYGLVKSVTIPLLVWAGAWILALPPSPAAVVASGLGVFSVFGGAATPGALTVFVTMLVPIPLFALNCTLIDHWAAERADKGTAAVIWTAIALLADGVAWFHTAELPAWRLLPAAALASCALLWGLHLGRRFLHPAPRRTLADVCLMSPFAAAALA